MDQTKAVIEACFANAHDLLRAAKRVLDDEQLPGISFHLSLLALEEIGKAALVGIRHIARSQDDEFVFVDKRLDDHEFKLFWALWTPSFAHGEVSREEFEGLRGMAKNLHNERLASLYVSTEAEGATSLLHRIDKEAARNIYAMAEARLGMETSREWQQIDLSGNSNARWFMDATEDSVKHKLIFGQASFDKLREIGRIADWIAWLKEEFDKADVEGREYLKRELARTAPEDEEMGDEKYRVRIRLYSPAQSIRNNAIRTWNQAPTWISLSAVHGDKHAVDVDFPRVGYKPSPLGGNSLQLGNVLSDLA